MMVLNRGFRQVVALLAVLWVVPASAQENLYGNKTAAQIFASDCALCHKTPQGLAKAGGPLGFGLDHFLREHYTASRESAAALSRYIQAVDTGPAAPERKRGGTAARPAAKKPAEAKSDAKSAAKPEAKPEAKPADSKPEEKKVEPVSETKAEVKPAEAKPAEKPPEAKPAEPKPAEAPKPEKSE